MEILRNAIGEVPAMRRRARQSAMRKLAGGKIELPKQTAGATQLAKMCGWQAPERHEIDHNFKEQQELVEVIARLRGR